MSNKTVSLVYENRSRLFPPLIKSMNYKVNEVYSLNCALYVNCNIFAFQKGEIVIHNGICMRLANCDIFSKYTLMYRTSNPAIYR